MLKKFKCWKNPTLVIFSNIFELFLLRVGGWVGIRCGVRNFRILLPRTTSGLKIFFAFHFFCLGLVVGLVFGVVLEIFEILLPRITSGLKIFFTFHFFTFFLQLGWYWVGFSKFFYLGWDGILFFHCFGF